MPETRPRFIATAHRFRSALWRCAPWLLILAVTFLAYAPALNGGLLMDDAEHIRRPDLQTVSGLGRIWFEIGATPHYYPLLNTAFWLEHRLWGDSTTGYHALNIGLHALAACLFVLLMRRLALPGALLAGLVFAVHPVCVESVAWIVEQKNTLSAVFYLASALVYLRFDLDRRTSGYCVALLLFIAALLTKSVTATLPPALLVIFWWQRGRLAWKRDVVPLLPWFGLAVGMGLLSAWFERTHSHASGAEFELTVLERCLVAGRALWYYASTALWPVGLVFIPPRWQIDASDGSQFLYPLGVALVLGALWWRARRSRGPLAAALLFVGTLFPVLGFLNINWFNFSYVADHFLYLGLLAFIAPIATCLARGTRFLAPAWRHCSWMGGAVLVGVLGVLTWRQSASYRDAETLYTATIERNPGAWLAHNNLGVILEQQPGGLPAALEHYRSAIRLKPDHARAHNNLGNVLLRMGRADDAIDSFAHSLSLQHAVPEVHANLGRALLDAGRAGDALDSFETALQFKPDYIPAHLGRARALAALPARTGDAIRAFRDAVRLQPNDAGIRLELAMLFAKSPGHLDEAIAQYREAIRLDPDSAEAYNNLGTALAASPGRQPEALHALEQAIRLRPDYVDAHYNLGTLLSEVPDRIGDAIIHLEQVVRLVPADADARTRLAAAMLRDGRTKDAVIQLERVVQLQPTSAHARVNLANALLALPERAAEAQRHVHEALQLEPGFRPALELAQRPSRK